MKIKELVSHIAEQEGKLKEVSVGNIREIVGIVSDLLFSELFNGGSEALKELYKNGSRRAKKKGKKS